MRYTGVKIECTPSDVAVMMCTYVVVGRLEGQDDSRSMSSLSVIWCLA